MISLYLLQQRAKAEDARGDAPFTAGDGDFADSIARAIIRPHATWWNDIRPWDVFGTLIPLRSDWSVINDRRINARHPVVSVMVSLMWIIIAVVSRWILSCGILFVSVYTLVGLCRLFLLRFVYAVAISLDSQGQVIRDVSGHWSVVSVASGCMGLVFAIIIAVVWLRLMPLVLAGLMSSLIRIVPKPSELRVVRRAKMDSTSSPSDESDESTHAMKPVSKRRSRRRAKAAATTDAHNT